MALRYCAQNELFSPNFLDYRVNFRVVFKLTHPLHTTHLFADCNFGINTKAVYCVPKIRAQGADWD